MDSEQFVARLKELGIIIKIEQLRRWSKQDLIPAYQTRFQPRRKKRGRPPNSVKAGKGGRIIEKARLGRVSEWPEVALEEAAAIWAVRNIDSNVKRDGITVNPEMMKVIRRAAATLDKRPFAVYILPPIAGPLSTQHITPEDIKMRFVSEDCDGLNIFPRANNADYLNELVVIWVAAREKVREWKSNGKMAQVLESGRNPTPSQIDWSQIDPWRVEVPCPWQIIKPALVKLFWRSLPSKNKNERREYLKAPFLLERTLSESPSDDILLFENGVDTREFFKIDVTDREGWTKAELEEKQRKLRSSTSLWERMDLEMYEARLKNGFLV